MHIITNNVPRDVIYGWELSAKEREDFDYIDWPAIEEGADSAEFFRYKGELYYLGNFMRVSDESLKGWQGIESNTAFSATVVRYVDNGERVIVGRVFS